MPVWQAEKFNMKTEDGMEVEVDGCEWGIWTHLEGVLLHASGRGLNLDHAKEQALHACAVLRNAGAKGGYGTGR